jgi:hypothetical protein
MIFCDTPRIAKLYVPEAHSAAGPNLLEAAPDVYASGACSRRTCRGFHRRVRERVWSAADLNAAARQFHHDDVEVSGLGCGSIRPWLMQQQRYSSHFLQRFISAPRTACTGDRTSSQVLRPAYARHTSDRSRSRFGSHPYHHHVATCGQGRSTASHASSGSYRCPIQRTARCSGRGSSASFRS